MGKPETETSKTTAVGVGDGPLGGRDLRIAIIGAGPGGLCAAIRLRESGFENFTVLEKSSGVGGTWYHNRYRLCLRHPGGAVLVLLEVNTEWSRPFARQPRDPALHGALRRQVRGARALSLQRRRTSRLLGRRGCLLDAESGVWCGGHR